VIAEEEAVTEHILLLELTFDEKSPLIICSDDVSSELIKITHIMEQTLLR